MHVVIIQYIMQDVLTQSILSTAEYKARVQTLTIHSAVDKSHSGWNVLHYILNYCYMRWLEMPLLFILDLVAAGKCLVPRQMGMCMKMDLQLRMGKQYSLGWQPHRIKSYGDVMAFRYGNPPSTILTGGIWKGIVWRRELATLVGEYCCKAVLKLWGSRQDIFGGGQWHWPLGRYKFWTHLWALMKGGKLLLYLNGKGCCLHSLQAKIYVHDYIQNSGLPFIVHTYPIECFPY